MNHSSSNHQQHVRSRKRFDHRHGLRPHSRSRSTYCIAPRRFIIYLLLASSVCFFVILMLRTRQMFDTLTQLSTAPKMTTVTYESFYDRHQHHSSLLQSSSLRPTTKRIDTSTKIDNDTVSQASNLSSVFKSTSSAHPQPIVDIKTDDDFLLYLTQVDGTSMKNTTQFTQLSDSLRHLMTAALRRKNDEDVIKLYQERTKSTGSSTIQDQQDFSTMPTPEEKARCQRYGLSVLQNPFRRRRIFAGSLIADDSWHTLGISAIEYHGILHTWAFVESNRTQSGVQRPLRFADGSIRKQLLTSPLLWGNHTQVHVDYYIQEENMNPSQSSNTHTAKGSINGLGRENAQRNQIFQRWKKNGMTKDDIGFLSDTDEVATRDFLLALQVCDVPAFRQTHSISKHHNNADTKNALEKLDEIMEHDCIQPKLSSATIVMEGSPKCLQVPRRISRPDWIIGECIDGIGDLSRHPSVPRKKRSSSQERVPEWKSLVGNVTISNSSTNATTFINGPLWDATDMRMITTGRIMGTTSHGIPKYLHTGYHFHNFFDTIDVLRNKYETYGHRKEGASHIPLSDIQKNDLGFMVECLKSDDATASSSEPSGSKWRQATERDWSMIDPVYGRPIAFLKVPEYISLRHAELQAELRFDESIHQT